MSGAAYYPAGAYNDPRAPYNQESVSPEVIHTDVWYTMRNNFHIENRNDNLCEDYKDQIYTPVELMQDYIELLREKLKADISALEKSRIKFRLECAEGWIEDDVCCEEV